MKFDPHNFISMFGISAIVGMLYVTTPAKHKPYEPPRPFQILQLGTALTTMMPTFCSKIPDAGVNTEFVFTTGTTAPIRLSATSATSTYPSIWSTSPSICMPALPTIPNGINPR